MLYSEYEVMVIGGGPAGLSAALYLARYDRRAALFDAGQGRSTWYQTNYNYLGFPGGITARDLRQLGRRQVAQYHQVTMIDCHIDEMARDGEAFIAHAGDIEWRALAVILCTGVTDHWPRFEGWEEYVGRSMFWCLTCDGYSSRGMRLVVTGSTDPAAATALQLQRFDCDVTLLTNADEHHISEKEQRRLEQGGIRLVHDRIAFVEGHDGLFVTLITHGGQRLPLDRLFNQQGAAPNSSLARDLGVELDEMGYVCVDSEQKTNVPGVYVAGDLDGRHSHQVTTAVHEGGQAASAANYFLYPPDLRED